VGPSGLRSQHLLDCLNSADSAAKTVLLEALLTLVTTVSAGRLHTRAAPLLCATRLIPLRKKDVGMRPIAVGDTVRRLVAKWLMATSQGRGAITALAPLQTAFAKDVCPACENRVAAAADGSEERLQLHPSAGHPGHPETPVPGNAPVGQTSVPAGTLVGRPGGHLVDPESSAGRPLGPLPLRGGHPSGPGRTPPRGALHRRYLDDGVFMGSVAEVEEVLGAL